MRTRFSIKLKGRSINPAWVSQMLGCENGVLMNLADVEK
jgi:hypothetical protein